MASPVSSASSPAASAPGPAFRVVNPKARPGSPNEAESACPVRDPDDGRCYPTADAADLAWIARAGASGAVSRARRGAHAASSSGVATAAALLADADLPLEADPDDDSEEDGGPLALVDARHPAQARSGAPGSMLTAEGVILDTPAKKSFWKNLARTVRGLLVVRKDTGAPVSLPEEEVARLFEMGFPLPIEQFPVEKLHDTFMASRGKHRRHHAIDLPAPRGTPIVAVVDGTVERLGRDRRGGIVCYQRDDSGKLLFYYAHMARHAAGLKVGDRVVKGQLIGEVGATGHATGPHLHFAVFRVDGESTPTKGLAVNPYLIFSTFVPR